MRKVTPDLVTSFGPEQKRGALIADVQPNSPAADVILEVNQEPITSVQDYQAAFQHTAEAGSGPFLIRRDDTVR